MHRPQWSRVLSRRHILWPLVAIELMLFATAVHSVAARVCRSPREMSATEFSEAVDQLATDITTDPTAPMTADTPTESPTDSADDQPPGALEWQHTYGNYTLRCFTRGFAGGDYVASQFEIWQGDALVYTNSNYSFSDPGDVDADATATDNMWEERLPPPGSDLTGRGQPDVVIHEFSGGAHCCSTYRIFELGDTFREVAMIEAVHGGIEFVDLDGDGIPEIKTQDWSYAYEFTCFAGSFAPEIVLRFQDDQYVMAADLMMTPALTDDELIARAAEVKDAYRDVNKDGNVRLSSPATWGAGDGALWNSMLELIYTGHEDQALRLFNLAWPEWARGKRSALRRFSRSVGASDYWQQIAEAQDKPKE